MERHLGVLGGVCALLAMVNVLRAEVFDSGFVENTGTEPAVIYSATVDVPGANSVYLSFHTVLLSGDEGGGTGSYLVLTSVLDSAVQTMHASHVAQWLDKSAFFNGDSVQIELIAHPGTGLNRIVFEPLATGSSPWPPFTCPDHRILSDDPRIARTLNSTGGAVCTAFIIDDAAHCLLSAGHCNSGLYVVEFNAPLSDPSGNIVHPPPSDQYAVDRSSRQFDDETAIGQDWAYFGCFRNSTTGRTPFEAQGSSYALAITVPPGPPEGELGHRVRITGYGTTDPPVLDEWNRAQKTLTGARIYGGDILLTNVYSSTGNSGSPVLDLEMCEVIGIAIDGGCSWSKCTKVDEPPLRAALADPWGVCVPDCNTNGIPDACDIDCGEPGGPCDVPGCGLSQDCSSNGIPDECLSPYWEPDCNTNGVADTCDILQGTSSDCGTNGVPDDCEPDCNSNGVADDCDILFGTSQDCNCNRIPDECDILGATSDDCNSNGIPDECEQPDCNYNGVPDDCDVDPSDPDGNGQVSDDCSTNGIPDECETDCNTNGVPDDCDISAGTSEDCTGNGIPDECEPDCNTNGAADSCDILAGTSLDCNTNGIPDECETDCNTNGVPDDCDVAVGTSSDCNLNGVPDECDIGSGSSLDCNTNDVPDECDPDCNSNGVPDDCDVDGYGDMFLAGSGPANGKVEQFDSGSEAFVGTFIPLSSGGLLQPLGMTFRPNGDLLVGDEDATLHTVRRYDGVTGDLLGDFVAAQAGGLFSPWDLTFGSNGNLFVANVESGGVGITGILEYDGQSGTSVGTFATNELEAPYGLTFGPSGNLFVCDHQTAEVVEFDGDTGALVGVFASPDGQDLDTPSALAFGPSGNLFVADEGSNNIVQFNGTTGALIGDFVSDVGAFGAASLMDLEFRPDGYLYVSHKETRSIYKYNDSTGALVATLPFSESGFVKPFRLAFRLSLADCNGNSVPDTCDLADWNTDGYVDLVDYAGFQRCFQQSTAECLAAFDRASPCGEGIDLNDYAVFHAQLTGPSSGG